LDRKRRTKKTAKKLSLYGYLQKSIFDKKNSIEETLKEIHSLSIKNGSKDNISLILIKKEDI